MPVQYDKNAVVITPAPKLNYLHNYVQLPYDYGRPSYDKRQDVIAIRQTVRKSLADLDKETGWKEKFKGRKVLIKPNLVFVTPRSGYRYDYDIPQTTDPRVFDATMEVLSELCDDIIIGEGSGLVTWSYAKMAGYDRIAKKYGAKLIFFEEESIDRYFCPKAECGQEVYVPRIISEVIKGERLYVSHPKMKCNIYTGVTLGFKNAMGTFSCNMRYRNHTWQIDKKLSDLLYLFKPDLTVVDGIIGGEGNTPGPNDPVLMSTIVTGTNSVEVDRVVTEMMGFDPTKNKLLIEAGKRGFGDPDVKVVGKKKVVNFRPAEPTLLSERFHKNWPNVKLYVGHTNDRAPKLEKLTGNDHAFVEAMEATCAGGCIASLGTTFEVMYASYTYALNKNRALSVIVGPGAEYEGKPYWIGEDGKAYSLEDLKALPGVKLVCGECSSPAKEVASLGGFFWIRGCGEVNNLAVRVAASMMPTLPGQADLKYLPIIGVGALRKYVIKVAKAAIGDPTEPHFDAYHDGLYTIPELAAQNLDCDWVEAPIPNLEREDRIQAVKDVRLLANFLF
ncbi:MAG: DUF362 domain-containing protein [Clostridiales bacterium]|nr:DUF362 domain-containing protein [Clostridiales bacterium]